MCYQCLGSMFNSHWELLSVVKLSPISWKWWKYTIFKIWQVTRFCLTVRIILLYAYTFRIHWHDICAYKDLSNCMMFLLNLVQSFVIQEDKLSVHFDRKLICKCKKVYSKYNFQILVHVYAFTCKLGWNNINFYEKWFAVYIA